MRSLRGSPWLCARVTVGPGPLPLSSPPMQPAAIDPINMQSAATIAAAGNGGLVPRLSITWFFAAMVALGLIVGGATAGVRAALNDGPDELLPAGAGPTTMRALATSEAWAKAWTRGDIAGLYPLLDPASQASISPQQF